MSPDMIGPWRLRCPEGHASVSRAGRSFNSGDVEPYWYCRACNARYPAVRDVQRHVEVAA